MKKSLKNKGFARKKGKICRRSVLLIVKFKNINLKKFCCSLVRRSGHAANYWLGANALRSFRPSELRLRANFEYLS